MDSVSLLHVLWLLWLDQTRKKIQDGLAHTSGNMVLTAAWGIMIVLHILPVSTSFLIIQ